MISAIPPSPVLLRAIAAVLAGRHNMQVAALVMVQQRVDVADDVASTERDGPDQDDGGFRHGRAPCF